MQCTKHIDDGRGKIGFTSLQIKSVYLFACVVVVIIARLELDK